MHRTIAVTFAAVLLLGSTSAGLAQGTGRGGGGGAGTPGIGTAPGIGTGGGARTPASEVNFSELRTPLAITSAETRRIAANIAKLPRLPRKPQ